MADIIYEDGLLDTKTDVGPSAPPIMPIESPLAVSKFSLIEKYKRKIESKLTLIRVNIILIAVSTIINFLNFCFFNLNLSMPYYALR